MKARGGWELVEKEDGPWLGRCQKSVCEALQVCTLGEGEIVTVNTVTWV